MNIDSLMAKMTLEEKVSMLAGADLWHTVPVERLGIPVMKVTDGPMGARGSAGSSGPTSACFPSGVALAATWNPELIEQIGQALAEETQAKGAHILLAPTVNIHRSPLAGRNFECYSEDPYLTGRMATAYIRGLQSKGVGACIKHFCCNDSEFERMSMSSDVGERALREIYLAPFYMAIRDARPWTIMSSYNRLNGVHCSENSHLLIEILKEEWGFDGAVISDWFGSYSPGVVNGGLDLEMPGPGRWLGAEKVLAMVKAGLVSETTIDDKVRRLLKTIDRVGAFANPQLRIEQALDRTEHRQIIRQAAAESIVLLRNINNLLPLSVRGISSIAVIGENARWAQVRGGGSADVTPHYVVSPLEGIIQAVGESIQVKYALGTPVHRMLPLLDPKLLCTSDGRTGFQVDFYTDPDLSGKPVGSWHTDRTNIAWADDYLNGLNPNRFSARLQSVLIPPESGLYQFSLFGNGQYRLKVGGQTLVDTWSGSTMNTHPWDHEEKGSGINLTAGESYEVCIEYTWEGEVPWRTLRIGCLPPQLDDPIGEAVVLAELSDVAIVFAGQTNEWESEGFDREDMNLPRNQAELIDRVAAVNPNTIVVLNTGAPVVMPWLEKVSAVMETWYAGQEAGNAIADVLFGKVNPSGKLPTTFPRRLEDTPAFINYPGENGRVLYGEGLFMGYRYYDKKLVEPLFPFGFGLSYTTFGYSNLKLDRDKYAPGDTIQISLEITNTGIVAGKEVVQLYVQDLRSSLVRPLKELKGFTKVALKPGEIRHLTFSLDEDALAYFDDKRKAWVVEPGYFNVLIGASSQDIYLTAQFEWMEEFIRPVKKH